LPDDFQAVINMLEEGRFPTDETISTFVSIDEVPECLAAWSNEPARFSKIIASFD
jgi:threonine dehydrogenase-like Zn-dependent dehydrogenase